MKKFLLFSPLISGLISMFLLILVFFVRKNIIVIPIAGILFLYPLIIRDLQNVAKDKVLTFLMKLFISLSSFVLVLLAVDYELFATGCLLLYIPLVLVSVYVLLAEISYIICGKI